MTLTSRDYKMILLTVTATVIASLLTDKIRKELQRPYD